MAGYTGSGFGLCLGLVWVLLTKDFYKIRGQNVNKKTRITCIIADISSLMSQCGHGQIHYFFPASTPAPSSTHRPTLL